MTGARESRQTDARCKAAAFRYVIGKLCEALRDATVSVVLEVVARVDCMKRFHKHEFQLQ